MTVPGDEPPTDRRTADRLAEADEAIQLRDVLVAGLAGAAADLAEVGRELFRASVLTRVQRVIFRLVVGFSAIAAAVSVVCVVLLLQGQEDARAQRDLIIDCTSDTGDCARRGQERTAAVVVQLNQATIAAVICGDLFDGEQAINDCITARLAKP